MTNPRSAWAAAAWLALIPLFGHGTEVSRLPFDGLSGPAKAGSGASIPGINPSALASLALTPDQRARVTDIERDLQRTQWRLMGSIREARWKQQDALRTPEVDAKSVLALYDEIAALRRQYFQAAIDARKRIEAILTAEQRVELSRWVERGAPGQGVSEERRSPR